MNVLAILIPISLILGGLGLLAFLWTLRTHQYDDLQGHAARLLLEDDEAPPPDEPDRTD